MRGRFSHYTMVILKKYVNGLLLAVGFLSALASLVLAAYACLSTPAKASKLYTMEITMTDANLTKVFPPYSGYYHTDEVLARYNFKNSSLYDVYRFGLFGWCGGHYEDDSFVSVNCSRVTLAYQMQMEDVLATQFNTWMSGRAASTYALVDLPESLPSWSKTRRSSLDQYAALLTGMGFTFFVFAFWTPVTYVFWVHPDGFLELCNMCMLCLWCLNFFWSIACAIALIIGNAIGHDFVTNVANVLNDATDYGITAKVGQTMYNLIWISMALQWISWAIIIYCLVTFIGQGRKDQHNYESRSRGQSTKHWNGHMEKVSPNAGAEEFYDENGKLRSYDADNLKIQGHNLDQEPNRVENDAGSSAEHSAQTAHQHEEVPPTYEESQKTSRMERALFG